MYIDVYKYTCMYIYTHTHTHSRIHTHVCIRICFYYVCVQIGTSYFPRHTMGTKCGGSCASRNMKYTYTHTHTHTQTYMYVHIF